MQTADNPYGYSHTLVFKPSVSYLVLGIRTLAPLLPDTERILELSAGLVASFVSRISNRWRVSPTFINHCPRHPIYDIVSRIRSTNRVFPSSLAVASLFGHQSRFFNRSRPYLDMSNSTLELQALELGTLWKDTSSSIYCEIASLAFLLYDHVISFDQEVERIWKAPWCLPKILFLFNRYTGPISLLVNTVVFTSEAPYDVCRKWIHFEGAAGITAMASVEMIMIFRLYALYRRSRIMLVLLMIGFLGNIGAMSTLMHLGLRKTTIFVRPGHWYKGCHPVGLPDFFWAYYVSPLIFETILLGLTLYKTLGHIRSKVTHTPVIKLFFRDGVAYFSVIFCTLLSNALIWMLAPPGLLESGIGLAIAMPTVMGSRILLNLRGLSAATPNASEITAVDDGIPSPRAKHEHGAPVGRGRILPTLTQWTVSGEESIFARMQQAEAEKYALDEATIGADGSSPRSSVAKGKGKEMDLEMSPISSGMSPGHDIVNSVLPHDSHFGRWEDHSRT